MTVTAAVAAVQRLARAFPKEQLDEVRFSEYVTSLEDIPDSLLAQGVDWLVRTKTDPWFPLIGQVREACARLRLALPTEAEALRQIDARMRWAAVRETEDGPVVHPLVKQALDVVGGYAEFRSTDRSQVVRSQFVRMYRDLSDQAVATQVGVFPPELQP